MNASGKYFCVVHRYRSQLSPAQFATGSAATLFLVLALGYVFDRLRRRGYLGIVYAFTAANGVLFALFYPVLTGVTIPRDYAWNVLKWLPDWPF